MPTLLEKALSPFSAIIPLPRTRIDGQRILVTGANSGLGFEAAKHFAQQGASVVLACRSREKALAAKAAIDSSLRGDDKVKGGGCEKVQVAQLDMASFASVQGFAEGVGAFDAAVLSAGVACENWVVGADGWERTLQVNVLSTALLGWLLLRRAAEAGGEKVAERGRVPTISIVSAHMYNFADVDSLVGIDGNIVRALNDEEGFRMGESDLMTPRRYSMSKLLDIYIARELAALAPKSSDGRPLVIVNSFTPGFCHSSLMRESGIFMLDVVKFLFARSTEKGSRTYFHAAVDAGVESHGEYINDCKIQTMPEKFFTGPEAKRLQARVWRDIMEVLGEVAPGVAGGGV